MPESATALIALLFCSGIMGIKIYLCLLILFSIDGATFSFRAFSIKHFA